MCISSHLYMFVYCCLIFFSCVLCKISRRLIQSNHTQPKRKKKTHSQNIQTRDLNYWIFFFYIGWILIVWNGSLFIFYFIAAKSESFIQLQSNPTQRYVHTQSIPCNKNVSIENTVIFLSRKKNIPERKKNHRPENI